VPPDAAADGVPRKRAKARAPFHSAGCRNRPQSHLDEDQLDVDGSELPYDDEQAQPHATDRGGFWAGFGEGL
jgi:hypothetical protein